MIEFLGPIIIVIMLAGFLLLPWLTPLSAVMMLGYSFKRQRITRSPFSCLLCVYGVISTLGIWFTDGMDAINHIIEMPQLYLLPQILLLILAIREQQRLNPEEYLRMRIYITLGLSSVSLYIMALAAVISVAA